MTAESKIAWIVGGGTGIGAATARRLADDGFHVALSGRRPEPLTEVAAAIVANGGRASTHPADATNRDSLRTAAQAIRELGPIGTLVFTAGTNVARRSWAELDAADFDRVVDTNLNAVSRAVIEVLPGMRALGEGQILIVSSWSGWQYFGIAGAAYVASKRALGALAESINDEEGHGYIRATHLCPGEVSTEIIMTRPVPPTDEERSQMLRPEHVADVIGTLTQLPREVCVNEMVVTSTSRSMYSVAAGRAGGQ